MGSLGEFRYLVIVVCEKQLRHSMKRFAGTVEEVAESVAVDRLHEPTDLRRKLVVARDAEALRRPARLFRHRIRQEHHRDASSGRVGEERAQHIKPALRRCEEIDNDDVCKRRRLRDADPFIAVGSRDDVQPVLAQPCRSGASKHRVIFDDEDAAAVPHDETAR